MLLTEDTRRPGIRISRPVLTGGEDAISLGSVDPIAPTRYDACQRCCGLWISECRSFGQGQPLRTGPEGTCVLPQALKRLAQPRSNALRHAAKSVVKKALGTERIGRLRRAAGGAVDLVESLAVRVVYARLRSGLPPCASCLAGGSAPQGRDRPGVLFVAEKWCDSNPTCGLSNNQHNLFSSLKGCELAGQDRFLMDEYLRSHRMPGDAALLRRCLETRPDVVVLTWVFAGGRYANPRRETLRLIARELGIPILAIWYDSVSPPVRRLAESLQPFVSLHVPLDSSTAYLATTRHPHKFLPMWTPQDPRLYHDAGLERDVDLSFVGSVARYPSRRAGLEALQQAGVDVRCGGGQREERLTPEAYARVFQQSKIALGFSEFVGGGRHQLKGRPFEAALCGAMLLESENPETARWFEPMRQYVPFSDENDLVDKARYYLAHDAERREIAARGHQKASACYTAARFWRTVLARVLGRRDDLAAADGAASGAVPEPMEGRGT